MTLVELIALLLCVVGLLGVVVPVLPGLALVLAGCALWATEVRSTTGWVVLAVAVALLAVGTVVKYALPGRRMRDAGVPWRTTGLGVLLGVVGFFVVPVLGLFLGFVLGVYLAERGRLGTHPAAWDSTRHALAAVGWSILIELVTGVLMTTALVVGMVTS